MKIIFRFTGMQHRILRCRESFTARVPSACHMAITRSSPTPSVTVAHRPAVAQHYGGKSMFCHILNRRAGGITVTPSTQGLSIVVPTVNVGPLCYQQLYQTLSVKDRLVFWRQPTQYANIGPFGNHHSGTDSLVPECLTNKAAQSCTNAPCKVYCDTVGVMQLITNVQCPSLSCRAVVGSYI